MGKPDVVTKEYLRRPDIFADVFNQFLYHGKQKILPEMLTELDTAEIAVPYGADGVSAPEQRYRDVVKLLAAMTDKRTAYCILAVRRLFRPQRRLDAGPLLKKHGTGPRIPISKRDYRFRI